MSSTFWPNPTFERQSCQNRHTGLKFSSKRENSALFMKIVQNAFFRSCAARFGQIAFLSVKLLKIVTLVLNLLQYGKTVHFPWKLYKTVFFGHAQHVLPKSHFSASKLSKSSHWPNILSKTGKRCAFHKNCRTLFSGHEQHVLAKSHFWASKLSKSSHRPEILFKTGKQCAFHENCTKCFFQVMRSTFRPNRIFGRQSCQNRHTGHKFSPKKGKHCAFHENCTKRSFQVMRNTFWPNRIFQCQSCQSRHTGLKFSPKRENRALFMKIVQNAFFRSCAACFGQIAFVSVKVVMIVTLALNSLQIEKTVRFSWILHKTLFSGHAQHVLAKSHFWASKLSKSSHSPQILSKKGKQCACHENCTKSSFQVMRSTFRPNRIFERQSCQNRHTGLKFSSKRENSALSMEIVQNVFFWSCAACFGQIAFLSVKVVKIVTLALNSLQIEKTVRFSWILHKTLFSGHAQHVLAKSQLWASKLSWSSHWPQIFSKKRKQCAFHENCTKRSLQVMRSTFWPNRIIERQSCQNRHTRLKFSPKRENSAHVMKIVQKALFRSCAARFGQIAFLSVKVVKIVILAWNSLQNGKTVRFPWKLYKTLFSGHAQHVLAKLHFWGSNFWKSLHLSLIL